MMDHTMREKDRDALRQETTNPLVMKLYNLVDEINLADKKHGGTVPDRIQQIMDSDLNGIIRSCEEWLDHPKKAAGEFLQNIDEEYLHEEPDLDYVKKVIDAVPEALLHENEHGYIPIELAVYEYQCAKCIPLLAAEASRRNIGPERGGLLLSTIKSPEQNILQLVTCRRTLYSDEIGLQILKDLRSAGLLLDQDIVQYNLIGMASAGDSLERLDYLLEIYPKALSIPQPDNGDFPLHMSNYTRYYSDGFYKYGIHIFEKLLSAGMEHYPEKLGFLFQPNTKGETPIQQALTWFYKDDEPLQIIQIIQNAIPCTEDCPILHHFFQQRWVFHFRPKFCDDFVSRYPDAMSFKDAQGRNLLHVAMTVENGLKLSDSLLATICNAQNVTEKDPETNLYPFMLAAVSDHDNDLTTVYKLLRFCPDVISRCLE